MGKSEQEHIAVKAICDFLAQGTTSFRGEAFKDALPILVASGAVIESGVVSSVQCDECEHGHLADVRASPSGNGYGWLCPEAGFVEGDLASLRSYAFHPETFLEKLAKELTEPGTFQLLADQAWRLGRYYLYEKRIEIVFLSRSPDGKSWGSVEVELRKLPPSYATVFFTPLPFLNPSKDPALPIQIALSELLYLADGKWALEAHRLKARLLRDVLPEKFLPGPKSGMERTKAVADYLQSMGHLKGSIRGDTKVIHKRWSTVCPGEKIPKQGTIRDHLTKLKKP